MSKRFLHFAAELAVVALWGWVAFFAATKTVGERTDGPSAQVASAQGLLPASVQEASDPVVSAPPVR